MKPAGNWTSEYVEVVGLGVALGETKETTAEAREAGADLREFRGWPRHCVGRDDQHPSDLGSEALRRALKQAGITSAELDMIIFAGVSRDYVPSWSVATEIAQRTGAHCPGLDITLGCLGTLAGMELSRGLLADPRRQFVAVVTAEKWSQTVNRTDLSLSALWAHSDGAAAVVLAAPGSSSTRLGAFRGASIVSLPDLNGYLLVKYGGTRHPVAPPGVDPMLRTLRGDMKRDVFPRYLTSFEKAINDICAHLDVRPGQMVCNQVSPNVVAQIEERIGLPADTVPRTGLRFGHVGGADIVLGLQELMARGVLGPTLLASSSPYCFAAGVLDIERTM